MQVYGLSRKDVVIDVCLHCLKHSLGFWLIKTVLQELDVPFSRAEPKCSVGIRRETVSMAVRGPHPCVTVEDVLSYPL